MIPGGGVGELVKEVEPRPVRVVFEANRHARAAGRNHLSRLITIREDDALRGLDLKDLASRLGPVWMANQQLAGLSRIDGRSQTPPGRPSLLVGEETEHDGSWRVDHDGAIEMVGESWQ